MKKSTGCYILGITWIFVLLIWLLRIKNIPFGFLWLVLGIFELIKAIIVHKKEKNKSHL